MKRNYTNLHVCAGACVALMFVVLMAAMAMIFMASANGAEVNNHSDHPKGPHSHIHGCEMGGHFVIEVHAKSLEERQKILNKTFEDWRRLNANEWRPYALSLHVWARPVESPASPGKTGKE